MTDTVYTHPHVDWHYHENAYFTFVLQGGVVEGNRKEVYECPAGSLLYHNWQDPHYNRKPNIYTRGMQIELDKNWVDSVIGNWDPASTSNSGGGQLVRRPEDGYTADSRPSERGGAITGLPEGSLHLGHPSMKLLFYRIFRESLIFSETSDALSELAIQQSLLEVVGLMKPSHEKTGKTGLSAQNRPRWVELVREMLHAEFAHPRSLAALAAELGLHPVHLSRDFRKYFYCSITEYIRQLRIGRALSLLAYPELSLTEIAFSCGFADQSHFIRSFKESQGCAPFAYRKLLIR